MPEDRGEGQINLAPNDQRLGALFSRRLNHTLLAKPFEVAGVRERAFDERRELSARQLALLGHLSDQPGADRGAGLAVAQLGPGPGCPAVLIVEDKENMVPVAFPEALAGEGAPNVA